MQTFLPYADFNKSARVLDYRRLGKQRVEAKQIYNALTVPGYGWKNHPAVKMWKGHEKALLRYGLEMCLEWKRRGFKDTLTEWFMSKLSEHPEPLTHPSWLGKRKFHRSHKSNLLRKDREYYGSKFSLYIPDDLPYEWNRE